MLFCGKIQIRISESKNGYSVFGGVGGANLKADHESIKSTFSSDSSDQIQIRIFEIHNLSVFFFGKGFEKSIFDRAVFRKKKKKTVRMITYFGGALLKELCHEIEPN